jgi:hypothetical protein
MSAKPPAHPGDAGSTPAAVAVPARPPATRAAESGQALPAGHRLHEFTLEALLRAGSHSLLYTARDNLSQRIVAIKEYMPAQWAHRLPDHTVALRSRRHADAFALGLRSFVGDARRLASFNHPSLQKVLRFWEGNGTAYAVMPYYPGQTLHDWLQAHEEPPQERWLKELLRPLLDALEALHGGVSLHRDIAPENILLHSGHRPVLLGFGTRIVEEGSPTLHLRPGYAPIEQYAEAATMKQGAWTDLYALCAVLHTAILGHAPVPSVARQIKDEQEPIARAAAGRYSDSFLRAIDAGLAVLPADRPQDVAALRALFFPEMFVLTEPAELDAPAAAGATANRPAAPASARAPGAPPTKEPPTAGRPAPPPASGAPRAAPVRPAPPARAAGSGRPWRGLLAAALAAAMVAAAAGWLGSRQEGGWSLEPVKAFFAGLVAPAPQREPFSMVGALQRVVQQADPAFAVSARPDKSPVVIGLDRLRFHVQSSQPGYLYLFLTGADASHLWLLFPNQADNDNRLEAGRGTVVPRGGWHITASGPAGTDHVLALVTRYPMDLDSMGLRRDGEVHELDRAMAERRWAEHPEPGSPLVGPPICPPGTPAPCEQRFGAALMQVKEEAATGGKD